MTAPGQAWPDEERVRFEALRDLRYRFFAPGEEFPVIAACALVLALVMGFFFVAVKTDPDTWVPILVLVTILAVGVPLCTVLAGSPTDKRLRRILLLGLFLKLLCAGPRYYLNEGYYDGEGDAKRYDQAGDFFVQNVADGDWTIEGSELQAFPKETRVVGYMTGVLYVVFGTSYFGGYIVFSFLSWLGLVFCFRAFQVAYPNAPPYLAAKLLFFLPSLMFWPASLGKDAVMVFLIGLLTLGVARVLTRSKPVIGALWLVSSGYMILQIRPHLLLVAVVALIASTFSQTSGQAPVRGVLFRVFLLALLIPALMVSLNQMDSVLGTKEGSTETLNQTLDKTLERTNIGNSAFEAQPVRSPIDIPMALVTVIYRPFLFEAQNIAVLISAIEGTLLIALTVLSARWIWRVGPAMYRYPFAAFCGAFVLGFVIAFSNIGNAGILARQRVQMFPLLILLVCAAREHLRVYPPALTMLDEPREARGFVAVPELSHSFQQSDPLAQKL